MVKSGLINRNPEFDKFLLDKIAAAKHVKGAYRTTGMVTIPVVFHFILNSTQLHTIGDSAGIANRVLTQIDVLNEDYNRGNADSSVIPAAFKQYYGNVNIRFGLAHTDPGNNATNGWEIVTTNKTGFDVTTIDNIGNYIAGRDAKHAVTGGSDAWDINSYINIWVVNMLDGSLPANYIGLTVPPSFTDSSSFNTNPYPKDEMGLLLRYDAVGRRTSAGEYFYPGIDLGRTCTHEMGHFFGLFHPWGDDGNLCPWNGGKDDGIADTPPECDANYHCPNFPKYDCCTTDSPGIMFMDYMDYSDDACLNMFTLDQITLMDANVSTAGESHSLTSHPQLLNYPGTPPATDNKYFVLNPAVNARSSVNFNQLPDGFESITVYNSMGQKVKFIVTSGQQTTFFPIDMDGFGKGVYILKIQFNTHTDITKIIIP